MRDILFRGKRTDNGDWVEGFYIQWPIRGWKNLSSVIVPIDELHDGCATQVEVVPSTVGQYTGLNDKNGKRIFENDLVTIPGTKRQGLPAKVRYNRLNARFEISRIGYNSIPFDGEDGIYEIVGNAHDNPELLK